LGCRLIAHETGHDEVISRGRSQSPAGNCLALSIGGCGVRGNGSRCKIVSEHKGHFLARSRLISGKHPDDQRIGKQLTDRPGLQVTIELGQGDGAVPAGGIGQEDIAGAAHGSSKKKNERAALS
jgi:hypothetical protein